MRVAYNEQMTELADMLGEMAGLAGAAMEQATQSLLQADLGPRRAGHQRSRPDHRAERRLPRSRRSPCSPCRRRSRATSGRWSAESRSSRDIDRMGALALHVAKIARRRHPNHVLPEEVNGYFAEMGRIAVDLGRRRA